MPESSHPRDLTDDHEVDEEEYKTPPQTPGVLHLPSMPASSADGKDYVHPGWLIQQKLKKKLKEKPFDVTTNARNPWLKFQGDIKQPEDRSIPFFHDAQDFYGQICRPLPPGRSSCILVEPGLHAVEVYEAIIHRTLGRKQTLPVYIVRAGASRFPLRPLTRKEKEIDKNGFRRPFPQIRDNHQVSFVMLDFQEFEAIHLWMSEHKLSTTADHRVCPYGWIEYYAPSSWMDSSYPYARNVLADLDLLGSDFSRSLLPPGQKLSAQWGRFDWIDFAPGTQTINGSAWVSRHRVEWPMI